MNDDSATISAAKSLVRDFCSERDWDQFHTPKELAIGISTESSELLEMFRFKSDAECVEMIDDPEKSENIRDELSDVFYFVLRFAQMNGIDLYSSLSKKIAKNGLEYPVETSKGSNRKYTEL